MQIILIASFDSGQAGFAPERIEGYDAPRRAYDVIGGQVVLAGQPDAILHHDADALLSLPAGLYRMPTPVEQENFVQAQQQANTAQEGTDVTPSDPDPNEASAQQKQKKASGG